MSTDSINQLFDVTIIGGGINGCGCAADAALRGLSVLLCEKGDLASQTSSKSTKLVHGGLRYLEQYHFSLVRKALGERQKLMALAPHLIRPQPIVLPYQQPGRPLWLLRAGLFLYDNLNAANQLPHTQYITRTQYPELLAPLQHDITKGFLFYDAITDDARLTITNALQAKAHGAVILPKTELRQAEIINGVWLLTLRKKNGDIFNINSKTVINTAGPWVMPVSEQLHAPTTTSVSLVKGSHIVVPKLYEGQHAYMLQHDDKRIVFTIPYHGHTLIGTTDVLFSGDPNSVTIDKNEIAYLSGLIQRYFHRALREKDIIATWSGVRVLQSALGKSPSTLSRDYSYQYTSHPAPMVTVYGGKITTYRQLAREVIDQLRPIFPTLTNSLTDVTPLPGGENFNEYVKEAMKDYAWLGDDIKQRYFYSYGTRTTQLLKGCNQLSDLGEYISPMLYEKEVEYLQKEEWATNMDDILWRRTKLGLWNKTEPRP